MEDIIDHLLVRFGRAILEIMPGRVSTETDARFSFDVQGSIRKAQRPVKLYEEQGIDRERVLIKIASTWEGIMAAEQLQKEGINCNMTLLFSLSQAVHRDPRRRDFRGGEGVVGFAKTSSKNTFRDKSNALGFSLADDLDVFHGLSCLSR